MTATPTVQTAIDEIVRRLVAGYAPQQVVLFGSYAEGEPDADSDIDLLIVKDTSERLLDRQFAVRRLTAGAHRHIPFDPIVLTPTEISERLRAGDAFIAGILNNGKVLYVAE